MKQAKARPTRVTLIRWANVGNALSEVLIAASSRGVRADVATLIRRLVEPLCALDELWRVALASESNDQHYAARLVDLLSELPRIVEGKHSVDPQTPGPSDCCCPGHITNTERPMATRADAESGAPPQGKYAKPDDGWDDPAASIFDEAALVRLTAIAWRAAGNVSDRQLSPEQAMAAVLGLVGRSVHVARLVRAYSEGGRPAMLSALTRHLSAQDPRGGNQTMSGSMPADFGLPALDDLPQPALPSTLNLIDIFRKDVADLIGGLRRPKIVDLVKQSDPYLGLQPVELHDVWDLYPILRCFKRFNHLMQLLNEPPPLAPLLVVWALGITSVKTSGVCAGDIITIRGAGFGDTQPAHVALLLPTLDGCRAVMPSSWSDTQVVAKLPHRVNSGPVGFGDAFYIAQYNAWAAKMRGIQNEIAQLTCGFRMDPIADFGRCPPSIGINQIFAGVAEILAFHANGVSDCPLEAGDSLVLSWTVKNAKTLEVRRLSATGPGFPAGAALTPAPNQTSHSFGPVAHTALEIWTYRLRATAYCGPPVEWNVRVIAVKRPALTVAEIQVTQGIQRPDHSVALVAGKPTVVRVLVRNGLAGWNGGSVPAVEGRIRMLRDGQESSWIGSAPPGVRPMAATPGATTTVVAAPSMNNTDETFNFLLPAEWCTGTAFYQVQFRVHQFAALGAFAGFAESVPGWTPLVTFQPRRALQFRYVRVNWNGTGAPTGVVCENTIAGAVPMLPTPFAGVGPVPGRGVEIRNAAANQAAEDAERRDMLNDLDDEHNCSAFEEAFEFLGFDCPPGDGTIWILIPSTFRRGEAARTPSNVCYTPPNDGPYAAHEIAHCLGQVHVRLPTGPNGPGGGVAASAWENNGMLLDTPFDTQGTAGSGGGGHLPRALSLAVNNGSGTGVGDIMTYWGTPNGTWPSPNRWKALWDVIGS